MSCIRWMQSVNLTLCSISLSHSFFYSFYISLLCNTYIWHSSSFTTLPFISLPRMDDTLDNMLYEPNLSGQDILPKLHPADIITAYWIQAFSHIDYPYTAFFSSTYLSLSKLIVCLYHKLDGYKFPSTEASSTNACTRLWSKALRPLGYSSD